jgi:hypothetical protein
MELVEGVPADFIFNMEEMGDQGGPGPRESRVSYRLRMKERMITFPFPAWGIGFH